MKKAWWIYEQWHNNSDLKNKLQFLDVSDADEHKDLLVVKSYPIFSIIIFYFPVLSFGFLHC